MAMHCPGCGLILELVRVCRRVYFRCPDCRREYRVHELATQLDPETEKILEQYNAIIYD